MSKERELLKRSLNFILPDEDEDDESLDYDLLLYTQISDLLAQPETQDDAYKKGYAQAEQDLKREPLSDDEIYIGFQVDNTNHLDETSFTAGVRFAEKTHGIGVE